MSPWKVILATLVIFCSGLITGAVLVRPPDRPVRAASAAEQPASTRTPQQNPSPWLQQQRELIRRMERQLDLSPEQREKVEKIMKESQERTKAIREKIAPELREEVKRLREQIRAELSPEQQKVFDEAVKSKPPKKGDDKKTDEPGERKRRSAATNQPPSLP